MGGRVSRVPRDVTVVAHKGSDVTQVTVQSSGTVSGEWSRSLRCASRSVVCENAGMP